MARVASIEIKRARNGEFYALHRFAGNRKPAWKSSETYKRKRSVINAIWETMKPPFVIHDMTKKGRGS